jgi:hypothetical protein
VDHATGYRLYRSDQVAEAQLFNETWRLMEQEDRTRPG